MEQSNIAVFFILSLILLAMGAIIYDKLHTKITKEDEEINLFPLGHKKMFNVYFKSPFNYLLLSLKNKKYSGVVFSLIYFTLFILILAIGILLTFSV